jgi:WD40 repeat protein
MPLPVQKFTGHTEFVTGVIHIPVGRRIVTCSDDGSLRVWSSESGEQIGNDWLDEGVVVTIALSPDGKKVVTGSRDGAVRLWDIDTGKVFTKWTGHSSYVTSVSWDQDRQVVSGCHDGTARVWDVASGKTTFGPIETGLTLVRVVHSPDKPMIATGGYSEKMEFIKIWDTKAGKLITNLKGHKWAVHCLAWTADGRILVSGSFNGEIMVWKTTTWQRTAVLTGHADVVNGIAISPNGRILASASWDKTARFWNLENSQPISPSIQHENLVNCVSFSADGKLLATGCGDNNAYTWDMFAILNDHDLLLNRNVSIVFLISL